MEVESTQDADDKTTNSETDNESSISSTTNSLTKMDLNVKLQADDDKKEKKQPEAGNCYWLVKTLEI